MNFDNTYEIIDEKFRTFIIENVKLETLATGMRWCEGGVWFGDSEQFLWSDIPNNKIMRWSEAHGVSAYRAPSNKANGQTRDREGRLVTCEHTGRRVTRTEHDGTITVIADHYDGKRLNSPNDVVVKSDGSVWFTDPPYGIIDNYYGRVAQQEQAGQYVFRFDPNGGTLDVMSGDLIRPNGLCFSPNESILYVSDTSLSHDPYGNRHIRAFNVHDGNRLSGGEVVVDVTPGVSDGFRCDSEGNIWTSAGDGVHCYTPEGMLLGKILISEMVANVTFGGRWKNRLFICATTSVYAIYLKREGVQCP